MLIQDALDLVEQLTADERMMRPSGSTLFQLTTPT
jgi:hypothetical protein